jgi:hypothetical protein
MKEMNAMRIDHEKLKRAVRASAFSKEQIVAAVQDEGYRFSLAGLDRMYKGEMPKNDLPEILQALALKLRCNVSDFYLKKSA